MRIGEKNWKVLASLFPTGWRQMASQSGAIERLRVIPSPDVLLRMLMLHVARGYGRLLVTLLAQKLIRIGHDISLSGGLFFVCRPP